jgi:hypothetical protein
LVLFRIIPGTFPVLRGLSKHIKRFAFNSKIFLIFITDLLIFKSDPYPNIRVPTLPQVHHPADEAVQPIAPAIINLVPTIEGYGLRIWANHGPKEEQMKTFYSAAHSPNMAANPKKLLFRVTVILQWRVLGVEPIPLVISESALYRQVWP